VYYDAMVYTVSTNCPGQSAKTLAYWRY